MHFLPYITLAESIFAALVCSCSTVVQCDNITPTAWWSIGCPRSGVHGVYPDVLGTFQNQAKKHKDLTYLQCEAVGIRVLEQMMTSVYFSKRRNAKRDGGHRAHAGPSARRDELFCLNITKMSAKC